VVPDARKPLEMGERAQDGAVVLRLAGELDMDTVEPVQRRLDQLASEGRETVLDLDELGFMDSVGIRLVLLAVERARANPAWSFRVTRGSEAVRRVFAASGLTNRLPYAW
jgi:anti-anti-sigma factor